MPPPGIVARDCLPATEVELRLSRMNGEQAAGNSAIL